MFLKNSDVLIFETDDAKFKFNRLTHNKKISYTVNNTLNTIFTTPNDWKDFKINKVGLNILCLTANYLHKNLDIIPRVIDQLLTMDNDLDFKFFISLEKKDLRFDDKYDRYISYLGRVELENLPILYLQMNILFMPTLLETFSTTYLEAMFMKVPIVASDMSFARDICGEATLYCSPLNEKDYAEKILLLYNNKELKNSLISKGQKELKRFGDSISRTKKILRNNKKNI
ncbi:glycosyltransferase [Capnocytophaga canimorsus]|nr:glycosyltransferase [Capnocytophaga canimorsus]WGU69964.1 glycosyltransferase [Capnocytophaga canimorsus]